MYMRGTVNVTTPTTPPSGLAAAGKQDASLHACARGSVVYVTERLLLDPYDFALLLTFATTILAFTLTPNRSFGSIALACHEGGFNVQACAVSMVLLLVIGHGLASFPSEHGALEKLARIPQSLQGVIRRAITSFVSVSGYWAVQRPFVPPAAKHLHASMAGTAMAWATAESLAIGSNPFCPGNSRYCRQQNGADDGLHGYHILIGTHSFWPVLLLL